MTELPKIDGYRLVAELGAGSLSSVYKAIEEPLGRTVALKVLSETISPSSPLAAQLEREARVLAQLCHPKIGLLHAFAKTETRMYLVLEFVDGFSLAALLEKRVTFAPECVAAIGADVARALAHAHERGIVHRDIKPANILLSRRGEVKVLDFGIAQQSGSTSSDDPSTSSPPHVEEASAFGTPAYMSPEQILGSAVDPRSDIFSLGVVLYQLICGARPFERGDETDRPASAHRIRREPAIPLHRRAPETPPALERIVMRALEKLPADRFPSADAMAERLEELAGTRGGARSDTLIARTLARSGLAPQTEGSAPSSKRTKRASVTRAVAGIAAIGATVVVGGAVLQRTAHREGRNAGARPLELVPPSMGYLRVLATPWAEVWVDGQHVDVTPFARAIPLSAGTHYVTLVHPNAQAEKRTIAVLPDETRTIDVVMAVPDLAPKEDAESGSPRAEREGP